MCKRAFVMNTRSGNAIRWLAEPTQTSVTPRHLLIFAGEVKATLILRWYSGCLGGFERMVAAAAPAAVADYPLHERWRSVAPRSRQPTRHAGR